MIKYLYTCTKYYRNLYNLFIFLNLIIIKRVKVLSQNILIFAFQTFTHIIIDVENDIIFLIRFMS